MRALLTRAILGAVVVSAAEIVAAAVVDLSLPLWAMITLPCATGIITFLVTGRLRALRRQRSRRRVSEPRTGRPRSRGPRTDYDVRRAPLSGREYELVPVPVASDESYRPQ